MILAAGHVYEVDISGENARPYIGQAYANSVSQDTRPDGSRSVGLILITLGPENIDVVSMVTVNSKCLIKDLGPAHIAFLSPLKDEL